ncbi:MAG TPA: hypothetical protein VLX68_07320 [Chitinivibrionales bacterium]|nr:hypothetical protein [Chitinivibrionales bacterium]
MKKSSTALSVCLCALIASTGLLIPGCGLNNSLSDEFARMASQEVANMSSNSSGMILGKGLAKTAATADTVYYDLTINPYHWDATIGGYIRTATVVGSDGYQRVRVDTVIFKDATGASLQFPSLATCKTISHVRNVTNTKGGTELDIRVVMNSVINLTPDTTHVKNGTITGTYDGDQVATGTITNVTRAFTDGKWQFPRSGTVAVDFPHRTYDVDFTGNGGATLTITNKTTNKSTVVTIQVDEQ